MLFTPLSFLIEHFLSEVLYVCVYNTIPMIHMLPPIVKNARNSTPFHNAKTEKGWLDLNERVREREGGWERGEGEKEGDWSWRDWSWGDWRAAVIYNRRPTGVSKSGEIATKQRAYNTLRSCLAGVFPTVWTISSPTTYTTITQLCSLADAHKEF